MQRVKSAMSVAVCPPETDVGNFSLVMCFLWELVVVVLGMLSSDYGDGGS
jgi:hypothetical protein